MSAVAASHVVIVGHCTIDDIIQADGQCLPGTLGGAAAYAALGAAMYGAHVTLITLLGADYPLDQLTLANCVQGVIDTQLVRRAGERSIHNVARYAHDGSRVFEIESWPLMEDLTPTVTDVPAEIVQGATVLLTPASQAKQLELAQFLRQQRCLVALDTELHYFPTSVGKAALCETAAWATYFLPSIEHLQAIYHALSTDPLAYMDAMRDLGCPWIVVKQGAAGSTVIDVRDGCYWRIPSIAGLVIADTTGAGDAFDGGFVAALGEGKTPVDAACWGTVAASFGVESVGVTVPAHFTPELFAQRYRWLRPRVGHGRVDESNKGDMLS